MMMPERVWPSAGAAVNIMVITPMAVPRRLGGKMLRMPLNSSGTKKAADMAKRLPESVSFSRTTQAT